MVVKKKSTHEERQERSRQHREEHDELVAARDALKKRLETEGSDKLTDELSKFNQLPISARTRQGLERGNYKHMTHIQAQALPHALTGRDVLGAAKTGSGKTLAFLVPVLERLHIENWEGELGLGALILTPTRELALQIFKVMQVVGIRHPYSAALLTGGRNVDEERKRLHTMSIVVGTPGRVLHHLTENSSLLIDNLSILVLDEADRLLDMGFSEAINGILDQLPRGESRQTLLFSATQSADVRRLANLCLNNPIMVAAHADTLAPTPQLMCQNFLVTELHHKLDVLIAFLKRHPNDKTIVFVNTCNQVKFMYLAISKLLKKDRIPTMCLTGKMKQFRRDEVFLTFCRCKSAVLFCTDVAARGLDFPLVHWVVQYDCPESVETYIHRAGRTARAGARGVCVLMLTPSEKAMLQLLHAKKIPLREIAIKNVYLQSTQQLFVALVVQGLKYDAQKAFTSYLRSLRFASNKAVFQLAEINVQKFSQSLGLPNVPDMSSISDGRSAKNLPWDVANFKADAEAAEEKTAKTRRERHIEAADMFTNTLKTKVRFAPKGGDDDEDDEPLFTKKAAPKPIETLTATERQAGLSKNAIRSIVKTADYSRLKELHLSEHKVFKDDDDDDENDDDDDLNHHTVAEVAELLEPVEGDGEDELEYAAKLRGKLIAASAEDTERVRGMKRARLAEKKEKVDAARRRDVESDSDESDISFDEETQRMLAAARGELAFSDDEDDDDAGSGGNPQPAEEESDDEPPLERVMMSKAKRHRAE